MNSSTQRSFFVSFPRFEIEVVVDLDQSAAATKGFASAPPDFLFAVGRLAVRVEGQSIDLIDEFNSGNLLEMVGSLSDRLMELPTSTLIPAAVAPGQVCSAMREYWKKIEAETAIQKDELNYDLLAPLLFQSGKHGMLVLYETEGASLIEVSCSSYPFETPPVFEGYSHIAPESSRKLVHDLGRQIRQAISDHR